MGDLIREKDAFSIGRQGELNIFSVKLELKLKASRRRRGGDWQTKA